MKNAITIKSQLNYNPITDTDSYKFSHWLQYPKGTTRMMSYLESRGGQYDTCTLFGLQYFLHNYLSIPITNEHVNEARNFALVHGEPFNEKGWRYIVEKYAGYFPVKIRAIPEGTIVPVMNALLTIECDDPECFWIVSWLETMLVRLWYPSTIATLSRESKKVLKYYLDKTSDTPEMDLPFKLHDFGARGVTTLEQSRLGGAAHLLSFLGSDTIEGIRCANHYYDIEMAGFSIPASEHSTMTMWGKDKEYDAFENFVQKYLIERSVPNGIPKLAACVSDSYNIFDAVKAWCNPKLRDLVKSSGGCLIIRPDSGDPLTVLNSIFNILESELRDEITVNSKSYKVLPPYFRVIQGDGIDIKSMKEILKFLSFKKWSTTNIAFGSGGGLLQKVDRDTQKWAFKCCAAMIDGKWIDVRKSPITDNGKKSKAGRLDLIKLHNEYETVAIKNESMDYHCATVMQTVFENGQILVNTTFQECRKRMEL